MAKLLGEKKITLAGWGVLAAMLALCAWGLLVTLNQRSSVGGTLLDIHRGSAEALRPGLEAFLEERERAVLDGLAASRGKSAQLKAFLSGQPLVAEPFFLDSDGAIEQPLAEKLQRRSPLVSDDPAPAEFERVLKVVWSQAPVEDKVQALTEVHGSEGMAPRWRLKALGTLAAVQARAGEVSAARQSYELLFEEFEAVLLESVQPSYLQLVLARSECLALSGRKPEAADACLAAAALLREGRVGTTFEEERFFLSRGRTAAAARGPEALLAWDETERMHNERRFSAEAIAMVRDRVQAHGLLEGPAPEAGKPQHFFERELRVPWAAVPASASRLSLPPPPSAPALLVWARTSRREGDRGPAVVGFRADPGALEAALKDRIGESSQEARLAAKLAGEGDGKEFLPLTQLSGDRSFLSIGFDRDVWEALVGEAQRPFAFAGVLIGSLAVLLTLGFLVFLRGVRREMALSRMKTEFVANVSHELKTPLALIRLFGETLLLDRVKSQEQRHKYCHIITRESERLAHLISNILNFASIEAGKKRYELRPCDIGEVVRETYESYKFHLDEKGFTHELRVEPGLPGVLADPDAVAQALINLLENSVKYSPRQKEVRVQVGASDGWVRLSVCDRGVGISGEDQGRIWEDYYRAREARALGTRGSGLGLSVVRHIVRAHKGRVELESTPGIGSTFTLVFPAASRESAEGGEPARSSSTDEDDPGGEP